MRDPLLLAFNRNKGDSGQEDHSIVSFTPNQKSFMTGDTLYCQFYTKSKVIHDRRHPLLSILHQIKSHS